MNRTKNLGLTAFLALFLGSSVAVLSQTIEYSWTGGQSGYEGEIFVSGTSGSGNASEVLPGSFIKIPAETLNGVSEPAETYDFPGSFTGTITWDSLQITSMNINGPSGLAPGGDSFDYSDMQIGAGSSFGQNVISLAAGDDTYSGGDRDTTGEWLVVAVPEPSSLGLLALGAAALGVRYRRKLTARLISEKSGN
jgi:hypothetical protein